MKKLFVWFVFVGAMVGLIFALNYGIRETEKIECYKWQNDFKVYPGFYLTEAEAAQCQALKIIVK